jgi:hypothetical protein
VVQKYRWQARTGQDETRGPGGEATKGRRGAGRVRCDGEGLKREGVGREVGGHDYERGRPDEDVESQVVAVGA